MATTDTQRKIAYLDRHGEAISVERSMRGTIRHASFVRKRGFPKLGELPDAGRGLLRIRSNQPINRKAIMRRKVIPWPCEPASSIAVVATSCLALFALSSRPVMRRQFTCQTRGPLTLSSSTTCPD